MALTLHGQIANLQGDLDDAITLLTLATQRRRSAPPSRVDRVVPARASGVGAGRCGPHRRRVRAASAQSAGVGGVRVPHGVLAAHAFGAQVRGHISSLSDISASSTPIARWSGRWTCGWVVLSSGCGPAWSRASTARRGAGVGGRAGPGTSPASWAGRGRSWIWLGLSRLTRDGRVDAAALDVLWSGWRELHEADMLMDCAELGLALVDVAATMADSDSPERAVARERAFEVVDVLTALADRNPAVSHLRATALAVRGARRRAR